MSEESQRPTDDNRIAWRTYWKSSGMPWRTEPEIDELRQAYLAERRAVTPDIEKGIYPFRDEHGNIKLTRADVEWLLATHESGGKRGPVVWNDAEQQERAGLDLRGADIRGQDLRHMPLACVQAGLHRGLDVVLSESEGATWYQQRTAAAHLEGTNLTEAHFEGAMLDGAHFEEALVRRATFTAASLNEAHFEWASLRGVSLRGVSLHRARFDGASLNEARLEGANLASAHLENALLNFAHLDGANLRGAFFSSGTDVEGLRLASADYGAAVLADIRWGEANLGALPWRTLKVLGDEQQARHPSQMAPEAKGKTGRLAAFELAVRANRQVATVLRSQGLNEPADHFAYRAEVLQQHVLWRQGNLGRLCFALLLWTLAGYGYRLRRILFAYGLALTAFAATYFALGVPVPPHTPLIQASVDALQVSLTAIHGRVFFEQFGIGSPLAWVAAFESVVGLVIEGLFTAMLVQRFFGGR